MQLTLKQKERFWQKVQKTPTCWLWQGCLKGNNRGSFKVGGRKYIPTEISLALCGESRQGGLLILHKCDNKGCVNPAHLYWGTQSNNMQDRNARHPGWGKKARESFYASV